MSCWTITGLSGCGTTTTLPEYQGERVEKGAASAVSRCQFPDLQKIEVDEVQHVATDAKGLKQLMACQVTEEKNHDIARDNGQALLALQKSYNAVIATTRRDHALAEFELNELEQDRRASAIEAWTYKGLLSVVLIVVAL